jgi:hypothetical protein
MISRWSGPVIAAAFLFSGIAIGHGIGPVGFLLAAGTFFPAWFAFFGWLGVLVLLSGLFLSGRAAMMTFWLGTTISFVVWLYLLWDSDWQSTILCSVHYFAAILYFLVYRPLVNPIEEQS